MKNNKSPGKDGLPYEFYKHFWSLLGPDLVAVFNSSYNSGLLPRSQRSALISLLYKKGDRLDTKNWRPISLLCTDYKILSKVLTNRLKQVLASVVAPDQVCSVPGRLASESVRVLQDTIDHACRTGRGGALISLDQEKAFDRVDWSFMHRVLQKMNFGPSFRRWVSLLYTQIYSHVLVNDHVSTPFSIGRGVRQGCPLSPLLYILVAESIASAIRADPHIDGYDLPDGSCCKIFQYADDTSILVMSDNSLHRLFSLFDQYERASGARLNVKKSHGLLFGTWSTRSHPTIPLNWSTEEITVLGCKLGPGVQPDWGHLLTKLEDLLALWKRRQLSYHGRALIVNVLGLSLFWYQATMFDVPKTIVARINKLIFSFIWNKKREWLARSSLTQPFADGGLGVVDVAHKILSLRSAWLRRFLSNDVVHPFFPVLFGFGFPRSFGGRPTLFRFNSCISD